MIAEEYTENTGLAFVPLHNPKFYHQRWELPKSKRSESKGFDKTKRYTEDTPQWAEP